MKKLVPFLMFLTINIWSGETTPRGPQDFLVADGSSSGTYKLFLNELKPVLDEAKVPVTFVEIESSGAIENLDALINNKVMGAFLHADVIVHRSKNEPTAKLEDRFQTLISLFPEDLHFIALTQPKVTGGFAGYGTTTVTINDVSSLTNLKVGAAGGGYITANIFKFLSDIPYQIVQYKTGAEVLKALSTREIDAALFVGAAPLPNIKELGADYKLLSVPVTVADKIKTIYSTSQVTYTNMSAQPVQTVSVPCIFVTRSYKSPKMVEKLKSFRKAFFENLDTLKETPGNHKKWQDVNATDRGPWKWLDLGEPPLPAPAIKDDK